MWNFRKDEERNKPVAQSHGGGAAPAAAVLTRKEVGPVESPRRDAVAHIGKSVLIKGEVSGSEDLYLDGEVEGTIDLARNSLTVGPNGRIRAHINAREVIIQGRVEGNIHAQERVELRAPAVVGGDIATQRIAIEDGACLKGKVDTQREGTTEAARPAIAASAAAASDAAGQPLFHGGLADTKK